MHMAYDVRKEFFTIAIDGASATRDELLDWERRDRLGVVVDRPLGGLDAGLLIMLAVTAFYDASKKRRMRPLYPDIFLFHAGGPWGLHTAFDFAPDHKEVFVSPDPSEMLRTINNRGITHLMLPDRPRKPVTHRYKEPEAAHDRIKQCFVYGRAGAVAGADVRISGSPFAPLASTYESALDPAPFLQMLEQTGAATTARAMNDEEVEHLKSLLRRRMHEVDQAQPDWARSAERVRCAKAADRMTDEYRRIDVTAALEMLDFTFGASPTKMYT